MKAAPVRESDLYPDLKAYLQSQGFDVKSEIGACDLMARRGEDVVVVEMKLSFSLALVMQGVARQAMFDHVYLAVPVSQKGWQLRYRDIIGLCRRLGLGLLAVKPGQGVEAHLDPGPYMPRKNVVKAVRLLREFDRRLGDPNKGGTVGVKRMTAYRQDALRCAVVVQPGAGKVAAVVRAAGVARAGSLLRDDHYGWFAKLSRGVYGLTAAGHQALVDNADEVARLQAAAAGGEHAASF